MTDPLKRRYFDNAATSFPKPPVVHEAMLRFANEVGASPGRGGYSEAVEAGRILARCRQLINGLIHGQSPDHVIFTLNATDALNLAIKGIARHHQRRNEPVHIITTWLDHNSVLRPFSALQSQGVAVTRVRCDPHTGIVDLDELRRAITPHTRLVAAIHGSNVSGTLQPISDIGSICRERAVPFLVDAAQTLGHLPIDVQAANIDLLAFPGHKGLLGPSGTGGLYLRPGIEKIVDTIREGGTGSVSELDTQPDTLPDKYEPGSHNILGIAGLVASSTWILERGVESLWTHEQQLIKLMLERLGDIAGLTLLGPSNTTQRTGVFSVRMDGLEPAELAAILEDRFGILARAGLHCAPLAHQTFSPDDPASLGAVRLSLGPFLDESDVEAATDALAEIAAAMSPVSRPR